MILEYFKQISQIPRASFHEEAIADYLVEFANDRGLEVIRDNYNNVLIKKDATEGYEDHDVVILQGHTDMVAEKNKDSNHNFDTDPLELIIEDGWLRANNTTLGADDGVAVAYMLAILDSKELKHPPLECIFTVQEEVGLIGAVNFDTSVLKGKRLIGLDSSGEHQTTISSTGGSRAVVTYPFKYEKTYKDRLTIRVKGLKGGHSGQDIDKERGSANKLIGQIFYALVNEFEIGLHSVEGGLKENAIPRESELIIGTKPDLVQPIIQRISELEEDIKTMLVISDPEVYVEVHDEKKDTYTMNHHNNKEFAQLFQLLPYGYFHKSLVIEGLTLSSMNIGTIRTNENNIVFGLSIRSPQPFMMADTHNIINVAAELCNAEVEYTSGYPGWNYDPNSKLRDTLQETYQSIYNQEMKLEATHGGLELGIFKGAIPELDIVAFGPIMHDIHTPKERLDLASFERTYKLLTSFLERL